MLPELVFDAAQRVGEGGPSDRFELDIEQAALVDPIGDPDPAAPGTFQSATAAALMMMS